MLMFAMLTHHENPRIKAPTWNQEITSKVCSGDGQAVRSSACDRAVQEGKDGILAIFFLPRQSRDGICSWKCYCACDQTIYKKHQPPKDSQAVRSKYPSPYTSGLMSAGRPTAKTTTPRPMARYNLTNRTSDSAESANTAYSA